MAFRLFKKTRLCHGRPDNKERSQHIVQHHDITQSKHEGKIAAKHIHDENCQDTGNGQGETDGQKPKRTKRWTPNHSQENQSDKRPVNHELHWKTWDPVTWHGFGKFCRDHGWGERKNNYQTHIGLYGGQRRVESIKCNMGNYSEGNETHKNRWYGKDVTRARASKVIKYHYVGATVPTLGLHEPDENTEWEQRQKLENKTWPWESQPRSISGRVATRRDLTVEL